MEQVAIKIAAMAQGSALEDQSGLVPMSLQNGLETDPSTYVEFHSYISAMQRSKLRSAYYFGSMMPFLSNPILVPSGLC